MFRRYFLTSAGLSLVASRMVKGNIGTCASGEVWELSTRHLPCSICDLESTPRFEVSRRDNCRWNASTIEELLAPSTTLGNEPLTIFYVHGNWMERCNALERVLIIERLIARQACEPFRLIMLSWPSQHDHGLVREVRDNADCADVQSFYLAWLMRLLATQSPRVSLLGFSFGARTVAGALQLDAGGKVFCRIGLECDAAVGIPVEALPMLRVSLVAPAIDRNLLTSHGNYSSAMNRVDHLVNLYNSRDPVLRRFRFIDAVTRPIAAGFAGLDAVADPRSTQPLVGGDRVEQYDCVMSIGSTHSEINYYTKCGHFRTAIDNILWK